ncbi:esterase/lipase [Geopyxis carbonaria]|nr:esterase/lipase [Geopyxis carbonaria]
MKILHNPDVLKHNTLELLASKVFPAHESPARILAILKSLALASRPITPVVLDLPTAEAAALKIHTPEYLTHLRTVFDSWRAAGLIDADGCVLPECFPVRRLANGRTTKPPKDIFARVGYYAFDMSTGVGAHTYLSAISSVDLAAKGAVALTESPTTPVFALCRPPGHHCSADLSGGYCYLNNTAVAVQTLLDLRGPDERVTVLDLDFHHGNGTQDMFYAAANPCYISIHGEDEYPYYAGFAEETGDGAGAGYNLNIPLPCHVSGLREYVPALEQAVQKVRDVDTRWLIVSLGFDTFHLDPLGKFKLRTEDYRVLAEMVGRLGLPTLIVLEGGYAVEQLGANVVSFLDGLETGLGAARAEAAEAAETEAP